jgi:hypothetical protein
VSVCNTAHLQSAFNNRVATCLSCVCSRMRLEVVSGRCVSNVKANCRYVRARQEEELQWSLSNEDLVPYSNGNGVALSIMPCVTRDRRRVDRLLHLPAVAQAPLATLRRCPPSLAMQLLVLRIPGKLHCGEEVLFRLSKVQVDGSCMEKVTCRSAATVNSGLVQMGRRMGKTLGVGPDSSALNVLSALHKHLASSP